MGLWYCEDWDLYMGKLERLEIEVDKFCGEIELEYWVNKGVRGIGLGFRC